MCNEPLTADKIKTFVDAWYGALDNHAPVLECYKMLAGHGLEMHFPDGDIWDLATFKEWYDRVANRFFDENHTVQSVEPHIEDGQAEVTVRVGWQASWWEPPAANTKRVALQATQKWVVQRSTKNDYGLEIVYYNAEAGAFRYEEGSAHLPPRETRIKPPTESILQAGYQQLCSGYHAIDTFRATLLGFLPLATGGIFLLYSGDKTLSAATRGALVPLGVFGIVVTLGLFAYEVYGIEKCDALIAAGKHFERSLGIDGQFTSRPHEVLKIVNEPFAGGLIYSGVLAAWTFLALSSWPLWSWVTSISVFLVGLGLSLLNDRRLKRYRAKKDAAPETGWL